MVLLRQYHHCIDSRILRKRNRDQLYRWGQRHFIRCLDHRCGTGASYIMQTTYLDLFILDRASHLLEGLSPVLFVIGAYILYLLLSFLIPSTSGLAYVSIPIMGALAQSIGLNPNVMVMIFTAGCGLVNLITPTSGVVMGGLELARVNYSTWTRFMRKPLLVIGISNLAILIFSMLFL